MQQKPAVILLLLLLTAGGIWFFTKHNPVGTSLQIREIAARGLAEELVRSQPSGTRTLVLSNPFTQRADVAKAIAEMEQAGLAGLRDGLGTQLAVGAVAFYFHLLAVEPARPRLLRGVALVGWTVGVAVMLWFNIQRTDRLGEELYMNHLFVPALRLAKPVASDEFVERLQSLQPVLDKKAQESNESNGADDEE